MGLDISIGFDLREEHAFEFIQKFRRENLSRTFCNFMSRKHAAHGEPELDQIGRITGVDVSPFYEMEQYCDAECMEMEMCRYTTPVEKDAARKKLEESNARLMGNVIRVKATVNALIDKLKDVPNLHELLNDNGYPTLNYSHYFTDFNTDKGEGYIDNNFGRDLRIFRKKLDYIESVGGKMVWFYYG